MSYTKRDKKHLWHPLTQHGLNTDHLPIVKAKGSYLYDDTGKSYIDGIASWYTCMYGHCNPEITGPIKKQIDELDQVVFSGFTHPPAIQFSEKLVAILPQGLNKIFFSDNGSTSVDVAIKMALQYYFNRGEKKSKIIALENAFHGDTFGAMSVSGLSVYNGPFEEFLLEIDRIPVPNKENIESVKAKFLAHLQNGEVAAFIFEPLVQGAAAMHMYEEKYLNELMDMARQYGALNIADEVMTGFGKTGMNFASDYLDLAPDLMCLSKSLTGGVAPMAVTCATDQVFDAFCDTEISKGFFHGHTYSANPLACTAASAGIDLLTSVSIQESIRRIHEEQLAFEKVVSQHEIVKKTRVKGVILALDLNVETDRYGGLRDKLFRFFMDEGVFLRPLGNTIYILPPFTITTVELEKIHNAIIKCLRTLSYD